MSTGPAIVVDEQTYATGGVDYQYTTTTTDFSPDGIVDLTQVEVTGTTGGNFMSYQTQAVTNPADNNDVVVEASQTVEYVPPSEEAQALLDQIAALQAQVSCEKLQHLGAMEDYQALFQAAQAYMAQVGNKNIELVVDTSVLDRFATDASVYAEMFEEVTLQFQRLSTVDDLPVLQQVVDALTQIKEMYDSIEKFSATITATSVLQLPQSICDASDLLQTVLEQIECSMPYLQYFSDRESISLTEEQLANAELTSDQQAAITAAINSLQLWVDLINNEANVTMNGNACVQAFKSKIAAFESLADTLEAITTSVQNRLNAWKAGNFVDPNPPTPM